MRPRHRGGRNPAEEASGGIHPAVPAFELGFERRPEIVLYDLEAPPREGAAGRVVQSDLRVQRADDSARPRGVLERAGREAQPRVAEREGERPGPRPEDEADGLERGAQVLPQLGGPAAK